jgi:hypothetical protein
LVAIWSTLAGSDLLMLAADVPVDMLAGQWLLPSERQRSTPRHIQAFAWPCAAICSPWVSPKGSVLPDRAQVCYYCLCCGHVAFVLRMARCSPVVATLALCGVRWFSQRQLAA